MVISMRRHEGGARFLGRRGQPFLIFLVYGNPEPCSNGVIKGLDYQFAT